MHDAMERLLGLSACDSVEGLRGACLGYLHDCFGLAAGIYLFNDAAQGLSQCSASGVPGEFLDEYEVELRARDPVLQQVCQLRAPSTGQRVLGTGWQRSRTGLHLRRWGLGHNMQGPLLVQDRVVGTLNVAAPAERGDFRNRQLKHFAQLCRVVSMRLSSLSERNLLGEDLRRWRAMLEELPQALTLSDAQGRIHYLNRAARSLLAPSGALRDGLERQLRNAQEGAAPGAVRLQPLEGLEGHYLGFWNPAPAPLEVDQRPLPPRARQVARLLYEGLPNKAIARQMEISEYTVKEHVANLRQRFGARNRTELARRLGGVRDPLFWRDC